MTEQESLQAAIHERVDLVPYDFGWPADFEAERKRLLSLFPDVFVEIEHFPAITRRSRPTGIR